MSDTPVDASKRTWLIASGCAGAVGAGFTAVPFVSSFQPSERAKAAGAPVEVDISALNPGEKITVEWRGKPVWILRRTPDQLATLPKLDPQLADPKSERKPGEFTPEYARNEARSIKPEYFVAVGISQYLGGVVANFASVPKDVVDPLLTLPIYSSLFNKLGIAAIFCTLVALAALPLMRRLTEAHRTHAG